MRIQTTNTDSPGSCPFEEEDAAGVHGTLDVDVGGTPTALPNGARDGPVGTEEVPFAAGGIQLVIRGGRSSGDLECVEASNGRTAWMAL